MRRVFSHCAVSRSLVIVQGGGLPRRLDQKSHVLEESAITQPAVCVCVCGCVCVWVGVCVYVCACVYGPDAQ